MIPLLHDFAGETVLIFGGGTVGARRARLFATEASVVVVSPSFADGNFADADLIRAAPEPEAVADWIDRAEPALVVAATDDGALNEAIESAARRAGALVNRVDRAGASGRGSVVVPAVVRDGSVTVAIATGGRSPALSGYLRERISDRLDGAGAMAELTGSLRADLRDRGVPDDERLASLRAVIESDRVWDAVRQDDDAGDVAREVVQEVLADEDRTDR